MKFEKLTDSKIKIIFTSQDMINNNVSTEGFFSDKTISQKILQSLLIQAEKEIGFKADDCKLLVEALASSDGGIIFTITKLHCDKEIDSQNDTSYLIFKFENFDNFLDLCTYIKNMNIIDLKDISRTFSLFIYKDEYYLFSLNENNSIPSYLIDIFIEFGDLISYTPTFDGLIHEYGKFIYKNNAICKCLKSIK